VAIELVPDLKKYPHIYGAHEDKKLIIFVGAGMSALWGCKRWKDMAISFAEACYINGKIDYWVKDALINKYAPTPRKLITICKDILGSSDYLSTLQATLDPISARKDKLPDLYSNLFAFNAVYITTNVDNHLSGLFDMPNVHFEPDIFGSSLLKPNNIIHIHGLIDQPKSLVLTIEEYVARYQHEVYGGFLNSIFHEQKYCFLFIGYGVDEMEIIDYMIEKYSKGPMSLRKYIDRFYILLPFFQNEEQLLKYEESYFQQINMTVIPYAINVAGYEQLDEVIRVWRNEITKPLGENEFYTFNPLIEKNL